MDIHDVAIIGAGPAGLSAAITLACEGRRVVLLDKAASVGGQISHSHLVENVVGYSQGFSGVTFSQEAYNQAINYGVDILLGQQVMILDGEAGSFTLITPSTTIHAKAVLITVGVSPKPLPFDVLFETEGCKITSELHLLPAQPGEHVIVYGGGNSAGQASVYYARQGCNVTLLSRRPIQETMDGRWITTLQSLGVSCLVGEICHVDNTVVFTSNGQEQSLTTPQAIHAFMGGNPVTSWLVGWVELDEQGYILTNDQHETATPGIFAAGDCESGSIKRFSCAIGGATEASSAISRYLSGLDTDLTDLQAWLLTRH